MSILPTLATALLLAGASPGPLVLTHDQYQNWTQPDGSSCCNNEDCKPTAARWAGTHWEAEFEGAWVAVPHDRVLKLEARDGLAHLCARRLYGVIVVYCFAAPAARI